MIAMLHMYSMLFIYTHILFSLIRGIFIVPNKGVKWRKKMSEVKFITNITSVLGV